MTVQRISTYRRSDLGMDHQVNLEELAHLNVEEGQQLLRDVAADAADDRRRFLKYEAVEHQLRHGTQASQLVAFHQLVAHIEADEMREDDRRLGAVGARRLHASRLTSMRRIFRDDIMPLLVGDRAEA